MNRFCSNSWWRARDCAHRSAAARNISSNGTGFEPAISEKKQRSFFEAEIAFTPSNTTQLRTSYVKGATRDDLRASTELFLSFAEGLGPTGESISFECIEPVGVRVFPRSAKQAGFGFENSQIHALSEGQ